MSVVWFNRKSCPAQALRFEICVVRVKHYHTSSAQLYRSILADPPTRSATQSSRKGNHRKAEMRWLHFLLITNFLFEALTQILAGLVVF